MEDEYKFYKKKDCCKSCAIFVNNGGHCTGNVLRDYFCGSIVYPIQQDKDYRGCHDFVANITNVEISHYDEIEHVWDVDAWVNNEDEGFVVGTIDLSGNYLCKYGDIDDVTNIISEAVKEKVEDIRNHSDYYEVEKMIRIVDNAEESYEGIARSFAHRVYKQYKKISGGSESFWIIGNKPSILCSKDGKISTFDVGKIDYCRDLGRFMLSGQLDGVYTENVFPDTEFDKFDWKELGMAIVKKIRERL